MAAEEEDTEDAIE
jgi:hypothetical protein